MAWTNAFDVGPCTIEVWFGDGFDPVFVPESEYAARGLTVSESGGRVTLSSDGLLGNYQAIVRFGFDATGKAARVSGTTTADTVADRVMILEPGYAEPIAGTLDPLAADGGGTYSPDPVELDPDYPIEGAGVALQADI